MKNFKNFQYKKYNLQTSLRFIYIYKKIRFISREIIIHHSITRRETFMFLKWGSVVGWKITINWKMFNLINRILKLFAVSQYNSIELVPAKRKRRRRRSLSWTFIWRGKNGKSCCFIFHPDYIPSIHLEQPWSIFLSYSWISSLSSFFSFYLKWDRKKSTNFFLYFRIRIRFSFRSFIVITLFQSITLLFSLRSFELHVPGLSTQQFRGNLSANTSTTRQDAYNLGEYLMDYSKRMSECITATYNCSRGSRF